MTLRTSRALALSALLATGVAGSGCGPDFDPYERLTSLRILGVRSEPVAPAPGETTELSALIYSLPVSVDMPDTATPVSYEWSWCPLVGPSNTGSQCLVTEEQLNAMTGQPVPPFNLGTADKAQFTHSIPPALLRTICMGVSGLPPPVDCRDGYPITIRLTVRTDTDEVTTIRPLRLRFEDTHQANNNPTLKQVSLVKGTEMTPLTTDVKLARRADNDVIAEVSQSDAETYIGLNDDLKEAPLTERLFLSWFVETGDLKFARTTYNPASGVEFERLLKNVWRPTRVQLYPRPTARLYLVLRDNREGTHWLTLPATVSLEDQP